MSSNKPPAENAAVRHPDRNARIKPFPPASTRVTDYDIAHSVTYLRLLDADAAGAAWQEAARIILELDPDADAENAHSVWQKHLARACWMRDCGFRDLLEMGKSSN